MGDWFISSSKLSYLAFSIGSALLDTKVYRRIFSTMNNWLALQSR